MQINLNCRLRDIVKLIITNKSNTKGIINNLLTMKAILILRGMIMVDTCLPNAPIIPRTDPSSAFNFIILGAHPKCTIPSLLIYIICIIVVEQTFFSSPRQQHCTP